MRFATIVLVRTGAVVLDGDGRWLALPALFFAVCLAWRDSPTLNIANGCALVLAGGLAALTARASQVRRAGLSQYALSEVYMIGGALVGLLPTVRGEVRWRRYRWWSAALAAARGVAAVAALL